jgi:hypothetical protein
MTNVNQTYSPTIDSEYAIARNEAVRKSELKDPQKFVARTMQQHHDYFVQKYINAKKRGKKLSKKDIEEYELAMLRARLGIVEQFH